PLGRVDDAPPQPVPPPELPEAVDRCDGLAVRDAGQPDRHPVHRGGRPQGVGRRSRPAHHDRVPALHPVHPAGRGLGRPVSEAAAATAAAATAAEATAAEATAPDAEAALPPASVAAISTEAGADDPAVPTDDDGGMRSQIMAGLRYIGHHRFLANIAASTATS